MNNKLLHQSIENGCLSIDAIELHPLIGVLNQTEGGSHLEDYLTLNELLLSTGLSFGEELESLESLIGGMELSVFQDDFSNLNFSSCSAGCAGTCSGNCFSTCADSCYNRCKSSYNS